MKSLNIVEGNQMALYDVNLNPNFQSLGAHVLLNYEKEDENSILENIIKETNGTGINLLMDCVMAKNVSLVSN